MVDEIIRNLYSILKLGETLYNKTHIETYKEKWITRSVDKAILPTQKANIKIIWILCELYVKIFKNFRKCLK